MIINSNMGNILIGSIGAYGGETKTKNFGFSPKLIIFGTNGSTSPSFTTKNFHFGGTVYPTITSSGFTITNPGSDTSKETTYYYVAFR